MTRVWVWFSLWRVRRRLRRLEKSVIALQVAEHIAATSKRGVL